MNSIKAFKGSIKDNYYFYFVYIPSVMLIFLIIMFLLRFPKIATQGVNAGIDICINTLLPSIFPFMFFSSLTINLKIFDGLSAKISCLSKVLFGLPGVTIPIIIMSVIGGYPVGAFLIKDAFEKGKITSVEGKRLLLFCVNPGIGFTYSMIGCNLYNSAYIGILLFSVSVLVSFIVGIFSRFYEDRVDFKKVQEKHMSQKSISTSLLDSMNASVHNVVNVCVWVIIFSCISALVNVIPLNKSASDIIKMLSEVTNGAIISKDNYNIFVLSAVIGFCGFCIHMQIMPTLAALKMKYSHFLCSRILSSGLYCVLTAIFLNVFSVECEAVSLGFSPKKIEIHSSVLLCVFLMIMCGLFVLGDGFTAYIKEKNISANNRNEDYLY